MDLRQEPRWLPDYVFPDQLRAEFIGRIFNAAQQNASKINSPALQALLLGDGPESLRSVIEFPYPFIPGPLEGGVESVTKPPEEYLQRIEESLGEPVLQSHSFAGLMNSALLFHVDSHQTQLAAKALRSAKHQLKLENDHKQLIVILRGLATVAAVARSGELAEELRILTWKYRREPSRKLSAEDVMSVSLIAAAAHSELPEWCEFVGDCITELAFQSLPIDEIKRLHALIEKLCHIVPELWHTIGRAEAALKALMGSASKC